MAVPQAIALIAKIASRRPSVDGVQGATDSTQASSVQAASLTCHCLYPWPCGAVYEVLRTLPCCWHCRAVGSAVLRALPCCWLCRAAGCAVLLAHGNVCAICWAEPAARERLLRRAAGHPCESAKSSTVLSIGTRRGSNSQSGLGEEARCARQQPKETAGSRGAGEEQAKGAGEGSRRRRRALNGRRGWCGTRPKGTDRRRAAPGSGRQ